MGRVGHVYARAQLLDWIHILEGNGLQGESQELFSATGSQAGLEGPGYKMSRREGQRLPASPLLEASYFLPWVLVFS